MSKKNKKSKSLQSVVTNNDGFNVESTEAKVAEVLQEVSDTLSKTLGPYGTTTIIEQRNLNHKMSKDGYTVLTNMFYKNSLKRTILEFIKKVSASLVNSVGDGSTSSVITANELLKVIRSYTSEFFLPPVEVINALEVISNHLQELVVSDSVKIDLDTEKGRDDLYNINFISTNGDKKVSSMITEIYSKIGKMGTVQLESGSGSETTYVIKRGIEFHRGMIDPCFCTERTDTNIQAVYENVRVIMLDCSVGMRELAAFYTQADTLMRQGVPVLVIASDYDREFVEAIMKLRQLPVDQRAPIVLVDIGVGSADSLARFEDIAVYIGASPYYGSSRNEVLDVENTFSLERMGLVSKIVVTDRKTTMIVNTEDDVVSQAVADRKAEILAKVKQYNETNNEFDYSKEVKNLMMRVASLDGSSAIIRVGGDSSAAIETKKFLYEDAIFASRSALFEGYILGGNTAIFKKLSSADVVDDLVKLVMEETVLTDVQAHQLVEAVRICFTKVYSKVIEVVDLKSIQEKILSELPDDLIYDSSKSMVDNIIHFCSVDKDLIFNVRTLKFEKFGETTIINSAATDREIVKSCFSIISLLATSNQIVKVPEFTQ